LREAGIVHAVREGAIRIAPHFHNNKADIARVIEVLEG
jgi:selenocysteine lyase/cysteine desulfurase